MSLQVITSPPDSSALVSLADHQSSTPASFSAEILHYETSSAKLAISSDQKHLLLAFFPDATSNDISIPGIETPNEGGPEDEEWEDEDTGPIIQDVTLVDLAVYVTTKNLIIYSPTLSTGYEIPYPSITLHAITSTPTTSGIYMQINTSDTSFDDHEDSSLEVTVYPAQTSLTTSAPASITASTQEMYKALTECSNLHPDLKPGFFSNGDNVSDDGMNGNTNGDDDDQDDGNIIYLDHGDGSRAGLGGISFSGGADEVGGIPALAPGGWITAENVNSIQWTIGGENGFGDPNSTNSLGPGAGTLRSIDEVDAPVGQGGANETTNGDGEAVKWRRTD